MTRTGYGEVGMGRPRISIIAALDRKGAIGRGNQLPWHLPVDLKRFKALTMGKPILMGRKTAQSIGRALPGRSNLVLTRSEHAPIGGMQVVPSFVAALEHVASSGAKELCVIGGAQIYALALPKADAMYLTHVDAEIAGADVFFPAYDAMDWRCVRHEKHPADAAHAYAMHFVECMRAP